MSSATECSPLSKWPAAAADFVKHFRFLFKSPIGAGFNPGCTLVYHLLLRDFAGVQRKSNALLYGRLERTMCNHRNVFCIHGEEIGVYMGRLQRKCADTLDHDHLFSVNGEEHTFILGDFNASVQIPFRP